MKTKREFRILKSGDTWILEELLVYRWWIFSIQKYDRVASSTLGPQGLIQHTKDLLQNDGVVWESTKIPVV